MDSSQAVDSRPSDHLWSAVAGVLGSALAGPSPKVVSRDGLHVEVNASAVTPEQIAALRELGVEVTMVNRRMRRRRMRGVARPLEPKLMVDGRTAAEIRKARNAAKRQRRELRGR